MNDANTGYEPMALYASSFYLGGGSVGIGTTTPLNTLDINGNGIHLASGTPSSTTYQLYNNGGSLYWNGSAVGSGGSGGGTVWEMIASTDISPAVTSYTFSGLSGDTDGEYQIVARLIAGSSSSTNYYLSPNADNTTSDYGWAQVYGGSSGAAGGVGNNYEGFLLGSSTASGQHSLGTGTLYAKSGYIRTFTGVNSEEVSGTTVPWIDVIGMTWSNTSNQITSLEILATQTNGLGVGTHLELWTKRTVGSSAAAGGSNTQVQYNSAGAVTGDSGFTYSSGNATLSGTITTATTSGSAVTGTASTGNGVYGNATSSGNGVYGNSSSGYGVFGLSSSTHGILGETNGSGAIGVMGYNLSAGTWGGLGYGGWGVYCASASCGGSGAWQNVSDQRLKTDIHPIDNALEKVLKLNGVTYHWRDPKRDEKEGQKIGLIAQNVETVFPQAVKTDTMSQTLPGGTKMLTYTDLIGPMVEAFKEFYGKWLADHETLAKLQADNDNLHAELKAANDNLAAEHTADVKTIDELRRRDDALERDVAELKRNARAQ